MIRNYFKIAFRNLKKQPFFTFLNIFGLTIGMAGSLLIALYIYDELNYDTMFPDADRIHRINLDIKFGGDISNFAEVSSPVAEVLENDVPQIELVTRFRNRGNMLIKKSETAVNVKEQDVSYTDPSFFDMFGIDLLYGDKTSALSEPNTLVLTRTAAEKHFKIEDAVGQNLILNNGDTYVVTGVIEDLPKNSLLRNHSVFLAMAGNQEEQENNWGSNNFPTFIKLLPTANIQDVQTALDGFFKKYFIPFAQPYMPGMTEEQFLASGNYYNFSTIKLQDIHLHSNRFPEMSPNGSIQNIYILSFIGLFLIILASVNFMNLSTAHSLKRAKEVGIRKTLGSGKSALVSQFLAESGVITFIALLVAIAVAALALPFFNVLADKTMEIPYGNPLFWLVLVICTLVLGLLSGIYPAFFMSRFIPVKVLKGSANNSHKGGGIRSSLVVFQFAISVFLIISTLVVFQQLQYIQNKDVGYAKDQVLVVQDVGTLGSQQQAFKQQVKQLASVKQASLSSYLPIPSYRRDRSFYEEGAISQENALQMQSWDVDVDYLSTLDLELVAGRDFNKKYGSDSLSIIINEAAVKVLGITAEEALSKRFTYDLGEENPRFFKVIGVVKDFHFETLRNDIAALSMHIGGYANDLAVKINGGDYATTVASIENIWKTTAHGQSFNHYFMEDSFNNTYNTEQRLGRIFITFTILSIFIACLGLFGLAAFSAEKRAKEIGVRKVLGASVGQITYKLSVDFLKLVGISIVIALPLAWYAMNRWLEDFEYSITIGWSVFVLAVVLALFVSILTISFQSIKAAIVNPIKSLRTE
ncbi:ABC transporter permease [Flavivirga algicola]|uniref:FtsX-like permease family protein n=1 Tax=Flavivirga algicola TaxID=2729136 RepID=A0ABX1RZ84_9FLAO|nr:ABC transporter permease [Flavivirga algicola]NMH88906.1 FtsX-like permease family protein [Flavivirga algicola]